MKKLPWLLAVLFAVRGMDHVAIAAESRTEAEFEAWAEANRAAVNEFEQRLREADLLDVYPLHQLARTASDWQICRASPFELPPKAQWDSVVSTLKLAKLLIATGVMPRGEIVSSYRNPKLSVCAGSSVTSAHAVAYALDIVGIEQVGPALCRFHRREGPNYRMGLSKYKSGRIHIDTYKFRTWGNDLTAKTSFCRGVR